jgi:hypothetical protein
MPLPLVPILLGLAAVGGLVLVTRKPRRRVPAPPARPSPVEEASLPILAPFTAVPFGRRKLQAAALLSRSVKRRLYEALAPDDRLRVDVAAQLLDSLTQIINILDATRAPGDQPPIQDVRLRGMNYAIFNYELLGGSAEVIGSGYYHLPPKEVSPSKLYPQGGTIGGPRNFALDVTDWIPRAIKLASPTAVQVDEADEPPVWLADIMRALLSLVGQDFPTEEELKEKAKEDPGETSAVFGSTPGAQMSPAQWQARGDQIRARMIDIMVQARIWERYRYW